MWLRKILPLMDILLLWLFCLFCSVLKNMFLNLAHSWWKFFCCCYPQNVFAVYNKNHKKKDIIWVKKKLDCPNYILSIHKQCFFQNLKSPSIFFRKERCAIDLIELILVTSMVYHRTYYRNFKVNYIFIEWT